MEHVDHGLQAGSSEDEVSKVPKPTAANEVHAKQRVLAFKVSHVLLTVLFLWLTYTTAADVSDPITDGSQDCSYHRRPFFCQRLSSHQTRIR